MHKHTHSVCFVHLAFFRHGRSEILASGYRRRLRPYWEVVTENRAGLFVPLAFASRVLTSVPLAATTVAIAVVLAPAAVAVSIMGYRILTLLGR